MKGSDVLHAPHLAWADVIRVVAATMIFLFHFTPAWVAEAEVNASHIEVFIMGRFNDWAIAAFLVLSAMALSLSSSTRPLSLRVYFARRLARVVAPYWTVAIPFTVAGLVVGEASISDMWKLPLWLVGLGTVSPGTFEPISEAWWYVSLALQIVIAVPIVLYLTRRWGLMPTCAAMMACNAVALALVSAAGPEWRYLATGLVVCRMPEVMIGVTVSSLVLGSLRGSRRDRATLATLALVVVCSLPLDAMGMKTSWGWIIVLTVLFAACALKANHRRTEPRWLLAGATLTYTFYLVQSPVSKYLVRVLVGVGLQSVVLGLVAALTACIVVAVVAEVVSRRYVTPPVSAALRRLLVLERSGLGGAGQGAP